MLNLLDYPFDSKKILRKKKLLKKELLQNKDLIKKKIAILGGSTTNELKEQLELFLLKSKIQPEFYECEFCQYYETVMFDENSFFEFNPDYVYLHVSIENLKSLNDQNRSSKDKALDEFVKLESIWKKINKKLNCQIIQDNFEFPEVKSLGNYDVSSKGSVINTISQLNLMIYEASNKKSFLHICDRNYLSNKYGLSIWKDNNLWISAKYSLSYIAITNLSYILSNIIGSIIGLSKKCLVLDLDNTLWGGVIGDDGLEGITLGKDTPTGEAYLEFQSYIKLLKKRGVILAVCSKNEINIAKSGFDHPDSVLKISDFTVFKANWDVKSKNILDIAKEINIGLDSLVFIDDNPAERELVRKDLNGQVCVPEIGDNIVNYRAILDSADFFSISSLSHEDIKRNEYYQDNLEREKHLSNFENYSDYLKSLNMSAEIDHFKEMYVTRITQLTNKTNQFNLTTKRVTETEIKNSITCKNTISLYARLVDKFGDNGLVSLIQGKIFQDLIEIELWLMSCRVFNRTLEYSLMYEFIKKAKKQKIKIIKGKYIPTKKNKIVSNIYDDLGFDFMGENEGIKIYELKLNNCNMLDNKNIKLEYLND